jgi:hypothetical protein
LALVAALGDATVAVPAVGMAFAKVGTARLGGVAKAVGSAGVLAAGNVTTASGTVCGTRGDGGA